MSSNLSSKSIAFATVTPSFVIFGGPYGCAIIAFLPFGPSVTYMNTIGSSKNNFVLVDKLIIDCRAVSQVIPENLVSDIPVLRLPMYQPLSTWLHDLRPQT